MARSGYKSNIAAVVWYIRNQEQPHTRMTFEEEFIAFAEEINLTPLASS
jgi:hypothetical protein